MPKLFGTFIRAVQGKPLFDPQQPQSTGQTAFTPQLNNQNPYTPYNPNNPNQQSALPQAQPQSSEHEVEIEPKVNKGDYRTFPIVRVKGTNTRVYNGQMEIRCRIINDSPFRVDVDKTEIFENSAVIKYPLSPRQDKEFLIYKGPCMHDGDEDEMSIEYKTENGDYFKSIHDVKFHINADRSFSVDEIELRPPIRDIYG